MNDGQKNLKRIELSFISTFGSVFPSLPFPFVSSRKKLKIKKDGLVTIKNSCRKECLTFV